MRFWIRLFIITALAWTQLAAAVFCEHTTRSTLIIGFTDNPGIIWQDSRLMYHGAAYEFSETISNYMNVKNSYVIGSPATTLQYLKSGIIDVIMLPAGEYYAGSGEPAPLNQPPGTISVALGRGIGWLLVDEKRPELAEQLRLAIATINKVNTFYQNDLQAKYHVTGNTLNLTDEERAYLEAHPVIRAMISPRQPPYAYLQDGQAMGVIGCIANRIEVDLGIRLEFVQADTHQNMMEKLTEGAADLVMDAYDDNNWAKAHNATLTFPYLALNYVAVMRKDKPLPEKPVIACARPHFYTQAHIEHMYPPEQRRYYLDVADCMAAVNNGDADMTFVKAITAQSDIYQGNYYNLYTNGNVVFSHAVAMAVSQNADPILVRILNKEITHINPQDVYSIINSEVYRVHAKDTLQAFIYRNPLMSMAVLGSVLFIIIVTLLYIMWLRRKHTHDLWQQANIVSSAQTHNLHWFANELLPTINKYAKARQQGELFVLAISPQRVAFIKEIYGTKNFALAVKSIIDKVKAKLPWILLFGLSEEITHAYMLCKKPPGLTFRQAAERIEKASHIIDLNGVPTSFTYHIGICPVPRSGDLEAAILMDNAMMAHNEIIGKSKNIGLYNTAMHDELLQQQQMELYMEKALAAGEFQIFLQAKYDLTTKGIYGAEALVRWQSPELGFLGPGSFINLFERNGFAVQLDYYVLERVCQQLQERIRQGLTVVPISVNQTGLHITERGYLSRMQSIAERYKLPRKLVELELTETSFIDFTTKTENENALQITRRLKSMGYALSMDDFCTGYSSIAMLRNLPMDIMKVDRSMLTAAEQSERSHTILTQVIELGQRLGMTVLVEGIETPAQEALLQEAGCNIGQGFLFARPIPAEQFWEKYVD
ncbi:MAG: EAL domain-containing protein [Selenomonas sp.]|nr:EAL domain-containing protein [Selenomonas sp.]